MNEPKPIALIGLDLNSLDTKIRHHVLNSLTKQINDYHVLCYQAKDGLHKPEVELFSIKELSPEAKQKVEKIIEEVNHESRTV